MSMIPDVTKIAGHMNKPTVAVAALGVATGGAYLATSKIAGVGDWAHPTQYADNTAIAGGLTALVGGVALISGGKGVLAMAGSNAKAATRQAATGMGVLKGTMGVGVIAGGSMGILKSHERMEKPFVEIRVKSEVINSFDAAKSVGDGANSVGGFVGDLGKNVSDAVGSIFNWGG